MSAIEVRNCIDILEPYLQELQSQADPKIQIMGGIAAAAFLSEQSFIDLEGNYTRAPKPDITNVRPHDGSQRDLDALVLSTSPDFVAVSEAKARAIIGDQLIINFFDLKRTSQLRDQTDHPWRSLAKIHVGDRYVTETSPADQTNGSNRITKGYKSLFPFTVPMPPEALQTHYVYYEGHEQTPMPTAHPGMMIASYLTRSISGLRPKDAAKVDQLASAACRNNPEIKAWLFDGPGQGMMHLARILHTLRSAEDGPDLEVGNAFTIPRLNLRKLRDDRAFMLPSAPPAEQLAILKIARAKARGIHFGESQQWLVSFWQKHIEQHIDKLVKNK